MSLEASIDLRIVENTLSQAVIRPTEILKMLISHGWNIKGENGYIMYLPLGDDDMFNWIDSKMNETSLVEVLEEKERLGELIGVGLRWQDTDLTGEVLLRCDEDNRKKGMFANMSYCLSNRKILADYGNFKITDVNWYLERLLPIFNQGDTIVEYFTYSEYR